MTAWKLAGTAIAGGVVTAGVIAPEMAAELLLGLAAPLTAATVTHVRVASVWRRDPGKVTDVLMRLFIAKLVGFGAYIAVIVGGLNLDAAPFMSSFVACFAIMHVVEAAHLRRLAAT